MCMKIFLQENERGAVHYLKLTRHWVMQQEIDPTTKECLKTKIYVLEWQSPYLTPNQNTVASPKDCCACIHPRTIDELKHICIGK